MQNRPIVYQTGGPFGTFPSQRRQAMTISRPANPWVRTNPQLSIGATPTSATLAGSKDACCGGCAAAHRQGVR